MSEETVSRRNIFQIIGAVPAAAAVLTGSAAVAAEPHLHGAPPQAASPASSGPYKRQTFDDHQWQTVGLLADHIIPADEHSGSATQAGVPEFLDDWIAFRTEQDGNEHLKATIFGGLMWLDHESNHLFGKNFADAAPDEQKKILDRIAYPKRAAAADAPWVHFFTQFRSLIVGGFFSSKAGVKDLPYLGNVAVVNWQGCDPKVWAEIESRLKTGYKGGVIEAKPWGNNNSSQS